MGSKYNILFILLLFSLSVFIRLPNIDRPLSSNYEWVTAHTLVTLLIWQEEGITNHGFNPIYTFPNANDHYIKCPISGVSNSEGDYFYVSYPPFSFIFPFLIFKLFQIEISAVSLQILNLNIHLVCSVLVFLVTYSVLKSNYEKARYPALLGTAIYIFSPINLWNHSNVYFADILVQLFFLLTVYFFYRLTNQAFHKKQDYIFFHMALFFMMYTEWLGVLLALCIALYALLKKRFLLFSGILLTTTAFFSLIFFQYSAIAGHEEYLNTLLNRYSERSGQFGPAKIYQVESHLFLLQMYLRNFFPFLVIVFFTLILSFSTRKELAITIPPTSIILLLVSLVPVILHHLILFEFTIVHELSLVKASVFIALSVSLLSAPLISVFFKKKYQVERSLYLFVVVAMFLLGVYFYYSHIIKPEEYASKRLGNQIKETSSETDTIFFKSNQTYGDFLIEAPNNFVIAPQIQYYAGRCIQVVANRSEALYHLQTYNKKQGIIYEIENPFYRIDAIERVHNPLTSQFLPETRSSVE